MSNEMSTFARTIMQQKYSHLTKGGELEDWDNIAYRVTKHVMKSVDTPKDLKDAIEEAIREKKFIPGGRYLSQTGRPYHQVNNCFTYIAEDSREGWGDLLQSTSLALMSGGGIGVNYSHIRPEGKPIRKTGGISTGPLALVKMINEVGRGVMSGGSRRSAIWAGLAWNHPDIFKFIEAKNWTPDVRKLKEKDFSFPASLDGTNISVTLDDDFFNAFEDDKSSWHSQAHQVYWLVIKQMLKTGEPGLSIDVGKNSSEITRNACTELTSGDSHDVCNLGSINLARVQSLDEMKALVELGTAFLLAGSVYSDVPYAKIDLIRTKNRRLGLGLMGLHEWLLLHGKMYGPDADLEEYLKLYTESEKHAKTYARKWELSKPIKTRAIAPNGSIGIIAETTTGIEPIYCVAYKRRYLKGSSWSYQYVVDPTAQRLINGGIEPEKIEDAYDLAINSSKRVDFQSWVQKYVDHAISSTINLPAWGSELNNENKVRDFGNMLYPKLKELRGITVYPDGGRSGQPLTPISYKTAVKNIGEVYTESVDVCDITKGGSCG